MMRFLHHYISTLRFAPRNPLSDLGSLINGAVLKICNHRLYLLTGTPMNIKTIVAFTALVISALALPTATAQIRSVTTSGIITWGYDETGVFGTKNRYLDGLSFKKVITANVNPEAWQASYLDNDYSINVMYGAGPAFTVTVTVDGWSTTFTTASTTGGNQTVGRFKQTEGWFGSADEITASLDGDIPGASVLTDIRVSNSTTHFVPDLDFSSPIVTTDITDASYIKSATFLIQGNQHAIFASTDLATISVSLVPEPATYGMLLTGLGILGLVVRRKRTAE